MKLWTFSAILFFSTILSAQDCLTNDIKPKSEPYGYKERVGDKRCEGLFTEKVGGQELSILSFTQGILQYYLTDEEQITIKAPQLTGIEDISVRGISFGMYDSYRLDLSIKADQLKKVPAKEVIVPNKISSGNLGIYGYLTTVKRGITYLPIIVSSKMYYNRIKEQSKFFLKLISNVDIEKAEWRYGIYENDKCGLYSESTDVKGTVFTSQIPLLIELPKGLAHKQICLNIRYKTTGGEWSRKDFNLLIP